MRLIDADDALARLKKAEERMKVVSILGYKAVGVDAVIDFIERIPTLDSKEAVHGRWDEDHWEYVCSCCQKHFTDELPWISHPEYGMPNYCPNCGAKMDKEE